MKNKVGRKAESIVHDSGAKVNEDSHNSDKSPVAKESIFEYLLPILLDSLTDERVCQLKSKRGNNAAQKYCMEAANGTNAMDKLLSSNFVISSCFIVTKCTLCVYT